MKKNEEGKLEGTPFIPASAVELMPDAFKSLLDPSEVQTRAEQIKLLSTLVMLSACFPTVYGRYFGSKVYPNLYLIVIGPPASGKGAIQLAKLIGDKIHAEMKRRHLLAQDGFKEDCAEWEMTERGAKPEEPKPDWFFIPGNVTSAGIYSLLGRLGRACVVDTETDALGKMLEQKFGDHSDVWRKCFHHETMSSYRKTGEELISVDSPKLTLLLTGTVDQAMKLIRQAGNGLFSRLTFCAYDDGPQYESPFSDKHKETRKLFQQFAEKISKNYFKSLEEPEREFRLTKEQESRFNAKFPDVVQNFYVGLGSEGVSIPMRMGLILFRIAMVLTAVRNYIGNVVQVQDEDTDYIFPNLAPLNISLPEDGSLASQNVVNVSRTADEALIVMPKKLMSKGVMFCHDNDFEAASLLVDVLLSHSLSVYSLLPTNDNDVKEPVGLMAFYAKLPDHEFQTKTAIDWAAKIPLGRKTTFKYLEALCEKGMVKKTRYGHYIKVKSDKTEK